jgi:hypothetical protein
VWVRRPAAGLTQAITPKFGIGSSFHPGSAPSQGATQIVGPQGYLPYWPHLKFPEGLRIGQGPANKSCSSGWVCPKFFWGGFTQNWGPQGPLHQVGVFALIIGRGLAKKSYSSRWVCLVKFYLWGAHPNPGPAGSTPPNRGICVDNFARASKQKLLLGVGLLGKILFVGGSPWPRACGVYSTKWELMHWELRGGQQTKAAPRGRFAW